MPIENSSKALDHEVKNNKVIALFYPFTLFLFYFLFYPFISICMTVCITQ